MQPSSYRSTCITQVAPSIFYCLSLHAALPICAARTRRKPRIRGRPERPGREKPHGGGSRFSRRAEEHTSELQSREKLVCRLLPVKKQARQRKRPILRRLVRRSTTLDNSLLHIP